MEKEVENDCTIKAVWFQIFFDNSKFLLVVEASFTSFPFPSKYLPLVLLRFGEVATTTTSFAPSSHDFINNGRNGYDNNNK